ncbi:hypothetical protein SprV_0301200700 [Sparganum proliferum]
MRKTVAQNCQKMQCARAIRLIASQEVEVIEERKIPPEIPEQVNAFVGRFAVQMGISPGFSYSLYEEFVKQRSLSSLTAQSLINHFDILHGETEDLLKTSFYHSLTPPETSIESQICQKLQEATITLEALLIGVSGLPNSPTSRENATLFSKILEVFWKTSFYAKKELLLISPNNRGSIDRIRSLQCFILIRAACLDAESLFTTEGETQSESEHFLSDTRLLSRLLTSVSNFGTQKVDGLFLLFSAVCGSSFLIQGEDGKKSGQNDLIVTASRYAITAISQLNVFQFLLDLLVNTEHLKPMESTHIQPLGAFELFRLPDSMSVVGLCEHLATFDLLTFMAKQIALESLDRDPGSPTNQNLFIKILSKALSVLIQCSGSVGMLSRSADPSAMGSLNIGSRVLPVIENVAQRFPYDLNFLDLCTALLSSTEERSDATVELVTQLVSSVPYFAQPMSDEIAAALSPIKAEEVVGEETRKQDMAVLLRQHWALPTDVLARKGFNQYAVSLSPGTRSILKPELGLIVWQHEYSVWPVVNAIVAAAEYSISQENYDLSADKNPPRSGSTSQPVLATTHLKTAFSRLATCLDFVDACLLAGIEPGRCLAVTDTMWTLVTGIFTELFSTEITGGRQVRLQQWPAPAPPRTPKSAFKEVLMSLTSGRLLPCLLRLTTHAIAYMQDADDSNSLAAGDHPYHMPAHPLVILRSKYSLSAFHRLYSDRILLPEAVPMASSNRSDLPKYTLSDCCLLRLIVDSPTDWYPSAPPSPSTRYRLISAYLDLALAVLEGERLAYLSGCSIGEYEQSSPSYLPTSSPLLAFLVFCINFVIEICQPGTSELAVKVSRQPLKEVCQRSDIFTLLNKALLFLVDLLTTHRLEEPSKDPTDTPQSQRYAPGFYGIQTYARELLASHEVILSCFIALTTVPVSSLPLSADSLVFDFLRFPTRQQTDQRFVLVLGQPKESSTWLALTLIHLLFPPNADATSQPQNLLLESLSGVLTSQGEAYFLKILRFLDFQCSTGLTRAAVNVLKKMVQYSGKLVSPFLGKISNNLRSIILQRLASPCTDQITRSSLFDWLSEAVLFDALKGPGASLFQGSGFTLLRILSSPPKCSIGDINEGNDRTSEQPLDILTVLISTLHEIDADMQEEVDGTTVSLYWSVLKLISAIWLQPSNPFRLQLNDKKTLWSCISKPFFKLLSTLESHTATLSTVELEVTGYLPAILSVEIYEYVKYGQPVSEDILSLCSKLVDSRVLQRWTKVAFCCISDSSTDPSSQPKEPLHQALLWSFTRWKSLFSVLLKSSQVPGDSSSKSGELTISSGSVVELVDSWLEKVLMLVSTPCTETMTALLDQLAICLGCAISYLSRIKVPFQAVDWFTRVVSILAQQRQYVSESQKLTFSHFHADLLAVLCTLVQRIKYSVSDDQPSSPTKQAVDKSLERLLTLCFDYLHSVSLKTRISTADREVFIQTVNILQSIWDYFDSYQLICTLTDSGTLNNLLVLLTEHSRTRNGASFCQALVLLLLRLLTPSATGHQAATVAPSSRTSTSGLYPNPFQSSPQAPAHTSSLSLRQAELVASYSDLLTQGLRLPAVEKLTRWLSQDEACEASAPSEGQSLNPLAPIAGDGGSWCELILSELRLLTLLSHHLGSPGHCSVVRLISGFMQDNQEQLSAMAFWWISDLRERVYASTVSSRTKVLEPFSDLIESGSVRSHRMALAEAVFEFYWSVLKSSDVHNLISPPCLALSTLFCGSNFDGAHVDGSIQTNTSRGSTIHVPADVWNTVCSMVIGESQVCALLLLRPGSSQNRTKDTATAPTVGGIKAPMRPSETRVQQGSASPSLSSSCDSSAVRSRGSLLEPCLLPLVRLLAVCLRLLTLSAPLLDSLSFSSVAEISTTMPITTLSFASPSLEISDSLSFGTLFSIARSSSQLLTSQGKLPSHLSSEAYATRIALTNALREVHELVFAFIFSQATLWLLSPRIESSDKHILSREFSVEFQSYNFFGRTSRRSQKFRGRNSLSTRQSPYIRSAATPDSPVKGTRAAALHTDVLDEPQESDLVFLKFSESFIEFLK